ncbi:MAG: DUF2971 domain-containing protein [Bacteroidota bacterium]|jgi:hypothetical protein
MILYKFVSAQQAVNILETTTIRFTQLAALNDPFESFPQAEGFVTREFVFQIFDLILNHETILHNLMEQTYHRMYDALPPEQKNLFDFEGYKAVVKNIIDVELTKRGTDFPNLVRSLFESNTDYLVGTIKQSVINSIANNICVLSLSTARTNPLMWSHYADSHRGLAIGFDSENQFFSKALRVQYRAERPRVNLFPIPETEPEKLRLAESILATKNISWHYEEEYRLINTTTLLKDSHTIDSGGHEVLVRAFPIESVQDLIFGCNIQEDSQNSLSEIVRNKFSTASLNQAVLDTKNFQISFKRL